ncbi:MAG: hypothetical protein WA667_26635 [Candidatus Nitrosopolaris sp.]
MRIPHIAINRDIFLAIVWALEMASKIGMLHVLHSTHFCDGWHVGATTPAQAIPSQQVGASQTSSPAPPSNTTGISVSGPINDLEILFFLVIVTIIGAIAWKLKHRGRKDRQRRYFSDSVKENILDKQHHKCAHCNRLLNVVDYDHQNGDRSNNKESNCIALCPNCHAIKSRRTLRHCDFAVPLIAENYDHAY